MIERYEKRIAQTALAEFLFLGTTSAQGSYALADSKTHLFALALEAMLDGIATTINKSLVPYIWRANGLPENTMPRLDFMDIEKPALKDVSAFIEALTTAGGSVADDGTQNALREQASLPPLPPEGPKKVPGRDDKPEPAAPGGAPASQGGTQNDEEPSGASSKGFDMRAVLSALRGA